MTTIKDKSSIPVYIQGLPYKTSVRLQHLKRIRKKEGKKQE